MVVAVNCTASGIGLEGRFIWNVPRVQGRILHSSEHIHVGSGSNVFPEITVLYSQKCNKRRCYSFRVPILLFPSQKVEAHYAPRFDKVKFSLMISLTLAWTFALSRSTPTVVKLIEIQAFDFISPLIVNRSCFMRMTRKIESQ